MFNQTFLGGKLELPSDDQVQEMVEQVMRDGDLLDDDSDDDRDVDEVLSDDNAGADAADAQVAVAPQRSRHAERYNGGVGMSSPIGQALLTCARIFLNTMSHPNTANDEEARIY